MKARFFTLFSLSSLIALISSPSAHACAACWGDTTGSKMGNAASWGIIAMVIIMFAMLGTLIGFGFYLNYRAKHPLPDYQELLGEDETQPNPGSIS